MKDKSNITRSPKKLTDRRIEHQNDLGEGRGTAVPMRSGVNAINVSQQTISGSRRPMATTSGPPVTRGSGTLDPFAMGLYGPKVFLKRYTIDKLRILLKYTQMLLPPWKRLSKAATRMILRSNPQRKTTISLDAKQVKNLKIFLPSLRARPLKLPSHQKLCRILHQLRNPLVL